MTKLVTAAQDGFSAQAKQYVARSLLIVDSDEQLLKRLASEMEARGFEVKTANSASGGLIHIKLNAPAYAVLDVRLEDRSGLDVIVALKQRRADVRIIVQTGYGNLATAVRAIKLGAIDYLTKPANADEITSALLAPVGDRTKPPEHPLSADRVRWEHIQSVYAMCGSNVSETARRLAMHRRTLQRILAKPAPR